MLSQENEERRRQYSVAELENNRELFDEMLNSAMYQMPRDEITGYVVSKAEPVKSEIFGLSLNMGEWVKKGLTDEVLDELTNHRDEKIPSTLLNKGVENKIGPDINTSAVFAELNNYLYKAGVYDIYEYAHARGRNILLKSGKQALRKGLTPEEAESYNSQYFSDLWDNFHQSAPDIKEEADIRKNSAKQALNMELRSRGETTAQGYPVKVWDNFSKKNQQADRSLFDKAGANTELAQEEAIKKFPDGHETLKNGYQHAKLMSFSNLAKGLYGSASHYFRDEYQAMADSLRGQLNELTAVGLMAHRGVNMKELQADDYVINSFDGGKDFTEPNGANHQVKSKSFYNNKEEITLRNSEISNMLRKNPDTTMELIGMDKSFHAIKNKQAPLSVSIVQADQLPRSHYSRTYTKQIADLNGYNIEGKELWNTLEKNAELSHKMQKTEDFDINKIELPSLKTREGYYNGMAEVDRHLEELALNKSLNEEEVVNKELNEREEITPPADYIDLAKKQIKKQIIQKNLKKEETVVYN